ncbi:MAG TPA: nitrate reductase associated protein [Caulobacteraceae bacterium]|nr:nitrate reductase associated protein [Caulobacteraceae bacterium]
MSEPVYFRFEQDFVDSLRCVPMGVRLKLDLCGVKLSLRQWSRFTKTDRQDLAAAPCQTPPEIDRFRAAVIALIHQRANQSPAFIPIEADPLWAETDGVPGGVTAQATDLGRRPPSLEQWRSLSELQRFALVKLSRPGHENENFLPALGEFGLDEPVEV